MTKTTDLLDGWYANEHGDGSMTIGNSEKGQSIHLDPASVERLREICRGDRFEIDLSPADRAFYRGFADRHPQS